MTARQTFGGRWAAAVEEVGDRPFLVHEARDGSVTTFTYREFDELVARVRAGLTARGLAPGRAVHLVHGNSVAFVATWLACATSGAWIVPSDPQARATELAGHVGRTAPAVGICAPQRLDEYRRAVDRAGREVAVVAVDEDDATLAGLADHPGIDAVTSEPGTRLAVMFTSGTTSAPKGVELTQANYAFAGEVMAAACGLTRFDRQLVVLPMFHANAQYYSFASAISVGASVALMAAFSASRFVEQARRHAATHVSLFAAPIRMILARTPPDAEPLALRHAWFAQNLSAEHFAAISRLLGCRPRQIYGMTETAPAVLINPPVGSRPNTIGVPALGCHVRVVDEHGRPVVNQAGAIQVGGYPGATLFRGYLDDPDTTAAAFVSRAEDGFVWFDTGDRAVVDEDGFHHFAGRRSDLLKVAGENVSVIEVEQVLAEHPDVHEVAVVGAPDPIRDEVPVAYVVPRDAATPGGSPAGADFEHDLRRWAESHLAPSKRPRAYHVVAELPRTSVGKIRKFLLAPVTTDAGAPEHSIATTNHEEDDQ